MDLARYLESCISNDDEELKMVEEYIYSIASSNFCDFMRSLSETLANSKCSSVARSAAGLILKNQLTSNDPTMRAMHQLKWHQLATEHREYIKCNLLSSMGTELTRPSIVAQCIAYIAIAELPIGRWNNLIPKFLSILNDDLSSDNRKESTLCSLGYISQELKSSYLDNYSRQILINIVKCLSKEQKCEFVRIAAAEALYNSLEFSKHNFEIDSERNYIMETVCDGIQSMNSQLAIASLECLVKVVTLYYGYIESYLPCLLFPNIIIAMNSQHENVALQGIEFWSNIVDEEMNMNLAQISEEKFNINSLNIAKHFALGALKYIFPILLEHLVKFENFNSYDDWGPMRAAITCIENLSKCCKNAVIEYFLPFYEKSITSKLWQYRNAGIIAFGSVLCGLEQSNLRFLLRRAIPPLIRLLIDPNENVRNSTSWTCGKICNLGTDAVIKGFYFASLMEAFLICLEKEPITAANICWAIVGLSEQAHNISMEYLVKPASSCWLSPYYYDIMKLLFWNTQRDDCEIANLKASAFETIMVMIKNAPLDCYQVRIHSMCTILQQFVIILPLDLHKSNHNDRSEFSDMLSIFCNTLQSVMIGIQPDDINLIADDAIIAIVHLLKESAIKISVIEDTLKTLTVMVKVLKQSFFKYLDTLKPYLLDGLTNFDKTKIFTKTVVLIGQICKNLKPLSIPYLDEFMFTTLTNLSNVDFIKYNGQLEILKSFGNIAIGIERKFVTYLPACLDIIMIAIRSPIDFSTEDSTIHLGCLRCLSNILQALTTSGITPEPNLRFMEAQLSELINFVHKIAENMDSSKPLIGYTCELIGKLCLAFGPLIYINVINEPVSVMLTKARLTKHSNVGFLAHNAINEIIKSQDENAFKT